MNVPDDAPYLCMADTRCRLCQFGIQEDDLVVARIEYEDYSSEFALRMNDTIHDRSDWINYHTCARPCTAGRRVPFFHGECFWFRLYDVSDAFVAAGEYTFEPPKYEEHRRFDRIRGLLAPRLRDILQVRLSAEILTMIAGLLVRECAMITAEEQSLGTDVSDTFVDLSWDIYVKYQIIDGVRYVKSLANTTPQSCDEEHWVFISKGGEAVQKIWIAEDFRGIRFIRFCSSTATLRTPAPIAKAWWRTISVLDDIQNITVKTDGVRLRDVVISDETVSSNFSNFSNFSNYVGWESPEHPTNMIDLTTLGRVTEYPKRLRMMSLDCNFKGTTEYTAVTNGHSVDTIHAHGSGDDTRFYAEIDASYLSGFLIHMPLDNGEFVTEICRRYALSGFGLPSVCLVFITNKGRSTLFGTSGPPDSCRALDTFLTPAPDGSQIFFNNWNSVRDKSIRYLAFDGSHPPTQRPFPASLIPNSPYFWTQSNESWFVSSCHVKGIVAMTLCRDVSLRHKPILGILLESENGHRDCLGQFRYDKFLEKIQVDQTTELYIGSRRTMKSFLYVADIVTSPPMGRGELFWMKVSQGGTMDWWSSFRHSIVRYTSTNGQFNNMAARR